MVGTEAHVTGVGNWRIAACLAAAAMVLGPAPLALWLLATGTPIGSTAAGAVVAAWLGAALVLGIAGIILHRRLLQPLADVRRLLGERADPERIRRRFEGTGGGEVARVARSLAEVLADLEHRRASGDRLALVASCTTNAVAITDAEGRVEWVNAAFHRWFGSDEAVLGRPLGEAIPSRGGDATVTDPRAELLEAFRLGEGCRGAFATTTVDDGPICVAADAQPVYSDDGVHSFIVVLSDITRQQELQEHVEAGHRRLEAILDAVPAIVMYRDLQGRLMHCNASAARLLGSDDARSLSGRPYRELAPEHAGTAVAADAAVFVDRSATHGVLEEIDSPTGRRLLRTDRVCLDEPFDGGEGVLAVATDVTDQQSLETRLDFAMRTGNLGVWEWEPRRGILTLSPQLLELLGHGPGSVDGTFDGLLGLVHEEDREAAIHAIDSGVCGQKDRFRREIRMRRGDGRWQWMLLAGSVQVRGVGARAERVVGVLIDIDRQKRDQASLAEAVVRAEAAGRARTAFLASMSHELRTPLTAILGYAELLQDPASGEQDLVHHTETIMRNGRHLVAMIDDILDLSRIESGRMSTNVQSVDLGSIVRDVRDTVELAAGRKGLEVELALDGSVPCRVRTDPVRLRQILFNVAGNAVKFTETGRVRIEVGAEMTGTDGCRLRFVVRDTGSGIAADVQARLFQPFERADDAMNRRHGGTGLGLAISQRLASMLDGAISVASEPGVGSTFTVDVVAGLEPAEAADGSSAGPQMAATLEELIRHRLADASEDGAGAGAGVGAGPSPAAEDRTPLDGRRILLAEDGPDNQRLISHHLRRAGAMVDVADNGAEAVRRLRQARANDEPDFDLVVMDMQMPVQDGYAATRELRAAGFDLPVIALTAHAMSGDRERCLEAGCTDYATKPIDRRSLVARCAALSAEARQARRARQYRDAA